MHPFLPVLTEGHTLHSRLNDTVLQQWPPPLHREFSLITGAFIFSEAKSILTCDIFGFGAVFIGVVVCAA
jgi:hypothetical protein